MTSITLLEALYSFENLGRLVQMLAPCPARVFFEVQ